MTLATIAASQTDAPVGSGVGTVLNFVIIVPETTAPGVVTLSDGSADYEIFEGGTLASVVSWTVPVMARSQNAGWTVTTGANVHVIVSAG